MNELFPIFLKLEKLRTLIIGGGNVGLEKLEAIIGNSPKANVTLVSPLIKNEIFELVVKYPQIIIIQRNFEWEDLNNRDLVICATDNTTLHKDIFEIAREKKILINVADTPDLCDFYLSSIVKKGDLKIAISTNGKSPTFAKRLKEMLNETLDSDNINELLESLSQFREKLKGNFNEKVTQLNKLTQGLISK